MQHTPKFDEKAPCAEALDGQHGHPFVRCNRDAPAGSSMIGVVLVTHGRLAVEFRAALEHVVGPQAQIEAVTGINLPMRVKLAKVRDECPVADAVAAAQEAGRKYVTIASRVLTGK